MSFVGSQDTFLEGRNLCIKASKLSRNLLKREWKEWELRLRVDMCKSLLGMKELREPEVVYSNEGVEVVVSGGVR